MKETTTKRLEAVLAKTPPEGLPAFRETYGGKLLDDARPFRDYMSRKLTEKGLRRQDVFLAADISEGYGYKLLAEEKHTVQRDVILRLCFGADFNAEETNRALTLYGMAPLYAKLRRDAVFLSALGAGMRDVHEIDRLLRENGEAPLYACR